MPFASIFLSISLETSLEISGDLASLLILSTEGYSLDSSVFTVFFCFSSCNSLYLLLLRAVLADSPPSTKGRRLSMEILNLILFRPLSGKGQRESAVVFSEFFLFLEDGMGGRGSNQNCQQKFYCIIILNCIIFGGRRGQPGQGSQGIEEDWIGWLIITRNLPSTGRWSLPVMLMSLYCMHSMLWSGLLEAEKRMRSHQEGTRLFYYVQAPVAFSSLQVGKKPISLYSQFEKRRGHQGSFLQTLSWSFSIRRLITSFLLSGSSPQFSSIVFTSLNSASILKFRSPKNHLQSLSYISISFCTPILFCWKLFLWIWMKSSILSLDLELPAVRCAQVKQRLVSKMRTRRMTAPLLPNCPPIPVLTVSFWTDLMECFHVLETNMISINPTISIFCTKIFLSARWFNSFSMVLPHFTEPLLSSSLFAITLLVLSSIISWIPKTNKSHPSQRYMTRSRPFNLSGSVALTFQVTVQMVNSVFCLFLSMEVMRQCLWQSRISSDFCLISSMNFWLQRRCKAMKESSRLSRNLFFFPLVARLPVQIMLSKSAFSSHTLRKLRMSEGTCASSPKRSSLILAFELWSEMMWSSYSCSSKMQRQRVCMSLLVRERQSRQFTLNTPVCRWLTSFLRQSQRKKPKSLRMGSILEISCAIYWQLLDLKASLMSKQAQRTKSLNCLPFYYTSCQYACRRVFQDYFLRQRRLRIITLPNSARMLEKCSTKGRVVSSLFLVSLILSLWDFCYQKRGTLPERQTRLSICDPMTMICSVSMNCEHLEFSSMPRLQNLVPLRYLDRLEMRQYLNYQLPMDWVKLPQCPCTTGISHSSGCPFSSMALIMLQFQKQASLGLTLMPFLAFWKESVRSCSKEKQKLKLKIS